MTSNSNIARVAEALIAARRDRKPCEAASLAPLLTGPEDAYEVQELVARSLGEGTPRYWKSGGASRAATLTHAPLPAGGVMRSPADARGMHFNFRWIEAEIAVRMGANRAPEAMCVSIEIVDSRWTENVNAPPLAKLADLQSHGALVLGDWVPYAGRDWARQRCEVTIGAKVHEFIGSHSLGDPTWMLPAWLEHAQAHGLEQVEGTVVTTGTWCGLLPVSASDLVVVRFADIGEARVQL
jgi:2-keto-4-pentenoate hydratase